MSELVQLSGYEALRLACDWPLAQDTMSEALGSLGPSRMVEAGGFAPPSESVRPKAYYVA